MTKRMLGNKKSRVSRWRWSWLAGLVFSFMSAGGAGEMGEVGFIEDFALAADRAAALDRLVPGTDEFFYYHALLAMHRGDYTETDAIFERWKKVHNGSLPDHGLAKTAQVRYAALLYAADPAESAKRLFAWLHPDLNHQAELSEPPLLPTTLSDEAYDAAAWRKAELPRLQNFTPLGLAMLTPADFITESRQTHALLTQWLHGLGQYTHPHLPEWVALQLRQPGNYNNVDPKGDYAGQFGSLPIHGQLTLDELIATATLLKELRNDGKWVQAVLARMALPGDVDADIEPDAWRSAWMERWAFIETLPPVFIGYKAAALEEWLLQERRQGRYDADRFIDYLKLPIRASYANQRWLEKESARINLSTGQLPRPRDEGWVRDFFLQLFADGKKWQDYATWVNDTWLKRCYAEAMLTNRIGAAEDWYTLYADAAGVEQLAKRVDLDFLPDNPTFFPGEEPVKLRMAVKNVPTLTIKAFRIQTLNWYRTQLRPITNDIDLDGLMAEDTRTLEFADAPIARVARSFEFPALSRPGVYVIEFIGNGRASRAIVRRGSLSMDQRKSVAGHVLTLYDENHQKVVDGAVWVGNQRHAAGKDGTVVVPFGTAPGATTVVLEAGDRVDLAQLNREQETYSLASTGFHVEREQLLAGRRAKLIVRPNVTVAGVPATTDILSDLELRIVTTDHFDVTSTRTLRDIKLADDAEFVHEFSVPENLLALDVELHAKARNLSRQKDDELMAAKSFMWNGIDLSDTFDSFHLLGADGKYVLEVRGKTGEARPDIPLWVRLTHPQFTQKKWFHLKTDAGGCVPLGRLEGMTWLEAAFDMGESVADGDFRDFPLCHDDAASTAVVIAAEGETIRLPYAGKVDAQNRPPVLLTEMRNSSPRRYHPEAVTLENGYLTLKGLAPGRYILRRLDESAQATSIVVAAGKRRGETLSDKKVLWLAAPPEFVQIESVKATPETVTVRLAQVSPETRVHVFATRYRPDWLVRDGLTLPAPETWRSVPTSTPRATYLIGRDIGDEYRYVLERKSLPRYAGSLLDRPGLLLQPRSLRETVTTAKEAAAGSAVYNEMPGMAASMPAAYAPAIAEPAQPPAAKPAIAGTRMRSMGSGGLARGRVGSLMADRFSGKGGPLSPVNLDWLPEGAVVLTNLRPDANGEVKIDRKALGAHQEITVLAVDGAQWAERYLTLTEQPVTPLDRRLTRPLPPDRHFTQRKTIHTLQPGESLSLKNPATDKLKVFDSMATLYPLFQTLSGNAAWSEFSFLANWQALTKAEKDEKYAKYACHELNFFLSRKDAAYFETSVKPYLKNKKDPAFMDAYLLGGDVSPWSEMGRFERLTLPERLLLADRLPAAEAEAIRRQLREQAQLAPVDRDLWNHRFDTALRHGSLEGGDEDGPPDQKRQYSPMPGTGDAMLESASFPASSAAQGFTHSEIDLFAVDDMAEMDSDNGDAFVIDVEMERSEEREELKCFSGRAAKSDVARRQAVRQHFRQIDAAKEWEETTWWENPGAQPRGLDLAARAFWIDYADYAERKSAGTAPDAFISGNFLDCAATFTDMALGLALLDVPFASPAAAEEGTEDTAAYKAGTAAMALVESLEETETPKEAPTLLVAQQYFALKDMDRLGQGGDVTRLYLDDEFLTHTVYACMYVVTNPTPQSVKVNVLLQIPEGAVPVNAGEVDENGAPFETRTLSLDVDEYETRPGVYAFYFPAPGMARHFPIHVEMDGMLVASAAPRTLPVVEVPSTVDILSWEYISQRGTAEECLDYLRRENVNRIDLSRMAWRMRDADFFRTALALLRGRKIYNDDLWGYALHHAPGTPGHDALALREYLEHGPLAEQAGAYLDSPILTVHPTERGDYRHLEYAPLVTPRAHTLGDRPVIGNAELFEQYHRFLAILAHKPALDDEDFLTAAYYLLLQDRFKEGETFFNQVKPANLSERVQHEYMRAWLALRLGDTDTAAQIATAKAEYPSLRWRRLFAQVADTVAQMKGGAPGQAHPDSREQSLDRLAASAPSLELKLEGAAATVRYQNLKEVTVRYYRMDVELLFSRTPFVKDFASRFDYVAPSREEKATLPDGGEHRFTMPEDLRRENLLVEVSADGIKRSKLYLAGTIAVQAIEQYGQLRVSRSSGGAEPLAKAYVKVYARERQGRIAFYKDGYTDVRGAFDYATLSTGGLDEVDRFAILVLTDDGSSAILEAAPPKQ